MLKLKKEQVHQLLRLIKNEEDRKSVTKFLHDLEKSGLGSSAPKTEIVKRKSAKKALNIIWRIGTEIGKHELISQFLKLFD